MDVESLENYEELKNKHELLQIKLNAILKFSKTQYEQNRELKYENIRLKSKLSSTSKHLAEKEKLCLFLKSKIIHQLKV